MSIRIIIKTPPPLCHRCQRSTVLEREGGQVSVYCRSLRRTVPTDIVKCSNWVPIGTDWFDTYSAEHNIKQDALTIDLRETPGQVL
jgi:hypothetical protein